MSLFITNPKDLVKHDNFCEKMSKNIADEIENSNAKQVALVGPYGSGKSVTLRYLEKSMDYECLYLELDKDISLDKLNEQELSYYLDLIISNELLKYPNYYDEQIASYQKVINAEWVRYRKFLKGKNYIGGHYDYKNIDIKSIKMMVEYAINGHITIMVDDFYKYAITDEIEEMIDNKLAIFEKRVIALEENEVNRVKNEAEVIRADYSKDIESVRTIISADVAYYNACNFDLNYEDPNFAIPPYILNSLIKKCEGNLNLLFETIRDYYNLSSKIKENDPAFRSLSECFNNNLRLNRHK